MKSPFQTYHIVKAKILFARKNFPIFNRAIFFTFFFLFYTPAKLIPFLLQKKFDLIKSYFKAIREGMSHKV